MHLKHLVARKLGAVAQTSRGLAEIIGFCQAEGTCECRGRLQLELGTPDFKLSVLVLVFRAAAYLYCCLSFVFALLKDQAGNLEKHPLHPSI